MNLEFTTYNDFRNAWEVIHSSILYWKKVRQSVEGKIQFYVNEESNPYTISTCNAEMIRAAYMLMKVEDTPYVEEEDGITRLTTGKQEYGSYSIIINKILKLKDKDDEEDRYIYEAVAWDYWISPKTEHTSRAFALLFQSCTSFIPYDNNDCSR